MTRLIDSRVARCLYLVLGSLSMVAMTVSDDANAQAQSASTRSPVAPVQAPQPVQPTGSLLGGGGASAGQSTPDASSLRMGPGLYRCESNRYVAVRRVTDDGKTAVLFWNQREHTLKAVDTQSGALRFEDAVSGLTWITIVGKSILLDTRKGQQLANDCRG
jgi:hypothetical protein